MYFPTAHLINVFLRYDNLKSFVLVDPTRLFRNLFSALKYTWNPYLGVSSYPSLHIHRSLTDTEPSLLLHRKESYHRLFIMKPLINSRIT